MAQRIRKCIPQNAECISPWPISPWNKNVIFFYPFSPNPANNLTTPVLPWAAFNRSQEHRFLQHILYHQYEYMHYILQENKKSSTPGKSKLICLFHGGVTFYCKADSTKDRKHFITYLHKLVRERQKWAKKNLTVSIIFTSVVSCTPISIYQKLIAQFLFTSAAQNWAHESFFHRKEYSVLDKTIRMYRTHFVFQLYREMKKH